MDAQTGAGTMIGMSKIKERRRTNRFTSYPDLHVGDCVPFYWCPRSVMLFLIDRANDPELPYKGGQRPIVHLEADFQKAIAWAQENSRRWAFTLSNAGSNYFEDRCDVKQLCDINWSAVVANQWKYVKEGKQAEFLIEGCFPWHLVDRIGVHSDPIAIQVDQALTGVAHRPRVETKRDWYY